ncbi:FAD-linked oxidoreductase [Camillea tinctor]|nr:FAD-linked oxidoreductase [Camillea tinctor]
MIRTPIIGRPRLLAPGLNTIKSPSLGFYYGLSHNFSMESRRRRIHGSSSNRSSPPTESYPMTATPSIGNIPIGLPTESSPVTKSKPAPLSVLPLPTILRTLATTTISSSPILLPPSLAIMSLLAHSENALVNPDKNPLLRWFMKQTFYAQFCAGENAVEVRRTVDGLKQIGFTGVILGYAKEVVLNKSQERDLSGCAEGAEAEECIRNEITPWANGTLETVRLAQPGDFVALKFSGAGRQALYALKNRLPPSKHLANAIDEICNLAAERDVPLLFDAEQMAIQAGIDDWTMHYQRKHNTIPGHAIIYGTYQAYLKSTPATLASHLAIAAKEGFTLGVKLVRGAYLGSDPRHIIHDTKADTDACYDGITESLIKRRWNSVLQPPADAGAAAFPQVSILLGSHNLESVRKARALRDSGASATKELGIAQLQGMADEVSCELLCAGDRAAQDIPKAYKYIVWGSTKECMKYLLRRAHENRDAVARTRSGRDAAWGELKRRVLGGLGLA